MADHKTHILTDQAVFEVVRDMLLDRDAVRLPGLGQFSVDHVAAEMESGALGASEGATDNGLKVNPPRDTIRFNSES